MQQEKKTIIVDSSASTRTGQDPKHVFTGMFQTHENENIGAPYTDFDYNHYKRPTKERSSKVAELRDAMRLTREITLVKANDYVDTARDVGNDFISDESYIQYYNSSLDSYIAEQTKINTDVYSGVRKRQVISLIINSNQSYH